MPVLNEQLFAALLKADPSTVAVQEGDPGDFSYAKPPSCFALKKDIYAHMEKWGECYRLNCPGCGDTRGRLFVCHRLGTSVQTPKGRILFSRTLYKCHNSKCDLTAWLAGLTSSKDYSKTALAANLPVQTGKAFSVFLKQLDKLPEPHRSLQAVESVLVNRYLSDRGFDPSVLEAKYLIRAVLQDAAYSNDKGEVLNIRQPRVLIPIVQHRILVGWQARSIDPTEKKYKYLFPTGMQKSRWLYNLDQALMFPDILITEGITNVWRIGEDSIALFGKVLHYPQLRLMQLIWGFDGLAVVCLDEDTYESGADLNVASMLRESQAFPRGVSVLRLRGGDPAEHTHERMRQLKFLATKLATSDPNKALEAVLDEKDVPIEVNPTEAVEAFVPDNRPPIDAPQVLDLTNVSETEGEEDYGFEFEDPGESE